VSRRIVYTGLLALMMSGAIAAQGQQAALPKGYQLLKAFQDRFTCAYPSKDWDIVPGGAASLVAVTHKKHEATIVIEYQPMQIELAPSEVDDNFAKLEVEPITSRQSEVTGLTSKILDVSGHRAIVIEYSRRGAMGPEHVRQYSLLIGKNLYRVIGSAPNASFEKYAPTFEVAAQSFAVTGAPAAAAPATPKQ
jgi:hypothetical protein